jgi:DNA topoisomerase IA
MPIGILSVVLLSNYFNELFEYEYTKNMEIRLDQINTIIYYTRTLKILIRKHKIINNMLYRRGYGYIILLII